MQVHGRDKLECGCKVNAWTRIDMLVLAQASKVEQTGTWVHQVARTMEEQLREDQQELKTREQKKNAKDAEGIRGIVHGNDRNKGTSHVQDDMEKLMHHDGQELLSLWEGWQWYDNKGGWLDKELCAKAGREEVECIRRHRRLHSSCTASASRMDADRTACTKVLRTFFGSRGRP